MNGFSIGEAWSQGIAFVSAHLRTILMFVVAGVLIPQILQFLFVGGAAQQMVDMQAMMAGQADPTAMLAAMGGGGGIILAIIGSIITSTSYYASWRHGLTNGTEDTGSTLTYAIGAAAMMFLATVVIAIVVVLLLGVTFGLIGAAVGIENFGLLFLLGFLMLFVMLWLAARLCLAGPVMADARSINPLYGLSTSWQLTAGPQWKIFGYFLLLAIVAFVALLLIGMVAGASMFGMMAGGAGPGAGSFIAILLAGVLISIPLALLYIAIPAGIYRTIVQHSPADVFA